MTYREEMRRVAIALGKLIQEGGTVPGDDIRAALAGHAAVVSLLLQVHEDLPDVEHRDFLQLGYALGEQVLIADQPLSAILTAESASRAGELWREVAKAATLAQHDWYRAIPASRPAGDAAWSEAADVAAVAEAIVVLSLDIETSLRAGVRWTDADDFRAQQAKLVLAARNMRRLTSDMALPTPRDLLPSPSPRVLVNLIPEALPEALSRLAPMVASVHGISPAHVTLVGRVVANAALTAAAGMETSAPTSAAVLREHAARLGAVWDLGRRLAPLQPGDARPRSQAEQIQLVLTRVRDDHSILSQGVARRSAEAIPAITLTLAKAVENQLASGDWVLLKEVPKHPERVMWHPGVDDFGPPPLLVGIRHAASHAEILARRLHGVRRPEGDYVYPRHLLLAALDARTPSSPLERHRVLPAPPTSAPTPRPAPPR